MRPRSEDAGIAAKPRPGHGAPDDRSWRSDLLGPLLVVVAIAGLELVSRFVTRIPNPPAVLTLVVAFAAFRGGLRSGLASSGVAWAYFAVAFSRPDELFRYAPDDLKRVVLWALATPGLAVMIGTLRSRVGDAERAATREAETRFTRAFHASPIGVLLSRQRDALLLDVNDVAAEAFGYAPEELVGRTALDLALWADPAQRAAVLERLATEGSVRSVDLQARRKSGELADLLCSIERLGEGDQALLLLFFVDLTERRREEAALRRSLEQLRASQKMEAIGRLAGGIAHDFNNLLTVIGGSAELLLRSGSDERIRTLANEIASASDRAAKLTRQLLAFSRHEPVRPVRLDLGAEVSKLESFLRRTIGEAITLSTERAPSLGAIEADQGQIDQVITNLVINARDAMPTGGALVVSTSNVELDDARVAASGPPHRAGRYVVLAVRDTGVGIPAEALDQVFEPFFTTKGRAGGTGLGLATVYAVVTQAGGFATVESELGKGTVFRLYFPRAGEATGTSDAAQPETIAGGSERILLVEDDAAVRKVTARMLETLGYAVVSAATPAEAITIASSADASTIALVMTDVVMPEMNGRELVDRLAPVLPRAGVLFFSGYPDDDTLTKHIRTRSVAFLRKPFTPELLSRALREVIDGRARAAGG